MKYREQAVTVQAEGCEMLSIVSLPAEDAHFMQCAVLIVTGGAQYRIGSHRQFTRMARQLATAGYPTMRFDMPGMGDSTGLPVCFEKSAAYIAASVKILISTSGAQKICLWGLCDGASASLLYMHATQDKHIAAMVLLNPWIRTEKSLAQVHVKYYYPRRLLEANFWRKFLSGNIGRKAARELIDSFRQILKIDSAMEESTQNQMAQGWASFNGKILLLLSERDLTAQEFKEYIHRDPVWKVATQKKHAKQYVLKEADHTCSQSIAHYSMVSHTLELIKYL